MKFIPQHDQMDCGPACLAMITNNYGKKYSLQYLREISSLTKEGVSLLGISDAAEKIGFETLTVKLTIDKLVSEKNTLPCILHWNQNHFVVLQKIKKSFFTRKYLFYILDPAHGLIILDEKKISKYWITDKCKGVALFLNPTDNFYIKNIDKDEKLTVNHFLKYLVPFKKQISIMSLLLFFGSLLNLIFPFLTQSLIDKGINSKNINIVSIILLAQLGVFLGVISFEIIRNWLMLFVGTKLSINIISEFLNKLLKLPIKYFETKMIGDFNQRIQDNERIEDFLTSQSLITFFSIITFLVFFGVLFYFDYTILILYLFLTTISILWSFYWLKKRKLLDYFRFQYKSENQESIYEMLNGVTEMKLNQYEDSKLNEWKKIQYKLFNLNIRILKINQLQLSGFEFINQLKNILVTYIASTLVIKGTMSLGELLAISYIIGQMNSPVNQLVVFLRSLQDAKLSIERLNEIQNHPTEEQKKEHLLIKNNTEIILENISFQYEGSKSPFVLKNINFKIPHGKITAIVGSSGSGKTTLMKLLLRFYDPTNGHIFFNNENILNISPKSIRENCGVVMQDGYIFSDTIARNIATGNGNFNVEKLKRSIKIANIEDYIDNLPLGYNTKIGASGNAISGGQKQRILIARAVYKNPQFIFFDEATSALDAENEKIIHDNLQDFFKGKTVLIIAHRLSTVKNADQIIVLKNGEIVEKGTHQELVNQRANYYNLVKNQLELGN